LGDLFIISLVRYEVHYWAGSDLFLIVLLFSYLNFEKLTFAGNNNLELQILELLSFRGFFSNFDLAAISHLDKNADLIGCKL
jgi:hypothetical protein